MTKQELLASVFDAGKQIGKIGVSIDTINANAAKNLASLGLTLPLNDADKAILETYRLEYLVGALVGGAKRAVEKARNLAESKNAKDREAKDKAALNAAGVNWLRIRERAGLKPKPAKATKPNASTAATAAREPASGTIHDVKATSCASTADYVRLFTDAHTLLVRTYDASASAMRGEAASIIRQALEDMGEYVRDAAIALAADNAKPATPAVVPPTGLAKVNGKGKGRVLEAQAA